MADSKQGSALDRFLRLFTDIRPGEGLTAVLLASNVFVILGSYWMIKPTRDAIVTAEWGPEMATYLQVANVAVLALLVPLYGGLADRLPRRRLIGLVTWIIAGLLVAFAVAGMAGVGIGIPFFVFGSIFNVMIVAQFWSFANDIYKRDEGERLFPIVAVGASVGGVVGAMFVEGLIAPFGLYIPMIVAAVILLFGLLITNFVDTRERRMREAGVPDIKTTATIAATGAFQAPKTIEELEELAERERELYEAKERGEAIEDYEQPGSGMSAFQLVWRTRYLLLIGVLVLFLNLVNTLGGYILGRTFSEAATAAVAAGGELTGGEYLGSYYASFAAVMNTVSLVIQLFITSRVVKYLGLRWGLLLLPLYSLGAYGLIAMVPTLAVVRWSKTFENATDYSLHNTLRAMLFLPTTREQKYKAKQVTDSFSVRAGDVLAGGIVFAGTTLGLTISGFSAVVMVLVLGWLFAAYSIGREYDQLVASGKPPQPRGVRLAPTEVGVIR